MASLARMSDPVLSGGLWLLLIAAAAAGALAAGLLVASLVRARAAAGRDAAVARAELPLRESLARAEERAARVPALEAAVAELERGRRSAADEAAGFAQSLSALRAEHEARRQAADEKLALLQQARESLADQFRALANDILEEKSVRFAEQNQTSLGQLLDPLKTRLADFTTKVEGYYVQEGQQRSALAQQVRHLVEMNQALSEDAKNLTAALKGSAKTQGNWGELILERVLEASGLRRGQEYLTQDSRVDDDGRRLQPDVVILLPDERRLVVDAKVTLTAYERFASAASDDERSAALRQHLEAVRAHLKGLSAKNYQQLYGLQSLDFVLMFVPIEPAFMLAVTEDRELFMNAWQRNVLLVSPSTLLFVVRTVANLWRQEEQHRNAQEIARRGAELYDRLCNFVDDLHRVGKNLDDARQAYEQAHRRLSTGKGNLIRQAEMLKALGVQPTKQLPRPLLEVAEDETGKGDPDAAPTAPGAGAAVVGLPRAAAGARPEQP